MDIWEISKLQYSPKMNTTVHDFPINPSISGVADLLVCTNLWRNNKKRRRFHLSMEVDTSSDFIQFNNPPKKIAQRHHQALIVVVCKEDASLLDVDVSGKTPPRLRGTLNFPSIPSANELSSSLQHFYCFKEDDHDCLCKAYPDGLLLIEGQGYDEQIDDVLKHYSLSIFSLISLDKIVTPEETQSGVYNYFVRQFAGDGYPKVKKTFITSNEIQGLQVNYKMANAREYTEHLPLSVGFFQSFCHVVKIQLSFLTLLEKGLERMGTYLGGQSVMNHRGGLSYLGPRKKGNM